jgi:hypothetical protein
MKNTAILTHSDLLARLTELKSYREIQETSLKYTFIEFISTINVVSFFKSSNKSNNLQSNDLLKSGLNMALNLVMGIVLGKNRSIKGYLSTMMVERFTTMIIDNNVINIISKIGSLLLSKKESK